MTVMAEGTTTEQEDVPRAPPPSPELPHQQTLPLDFTKLLAIDILSNIDSPSSSTEHSRPSSPLFYHSPEHVQCNSRPLSPSFEVANSPYNFSSKLSELTLTTPGSSSYQENSGMYIGSNSGVLGGKELMCGSLPVNGHVYPPIYQQHSLTSDSSYNIYHEEDNGNGGHRRRKISLKRHHGDQEEYINDVRYHGIEMKKLCHGKDRVGSAPPSHITRRSHTFSGSTNTSHLTPCRVSERYSMNHDNSSSVVGSLPSNHHTSDLMTRDRACSTGSQLNQRSSDCLSPGGLKTIGFATTNGVTASDEQMEGIETVEERDETPPTIPISVTQMDWSGDGLSLANNATSTNYVPQSSMNNFSFAYPTQYSNHHNPSFSFNLTVPGIVSDSCPHNGFLTDQQDTSISHISLDPHHFSKSL